MRQFFILLLCVLLAVPVLAVENSVTFSPLLGSAQFQNRIVYVLVQEAPVVETENVSPYTPVCHTARAALAARVAANPASYAPVFGPHLIAGINITSAGALTGSGVTLDTPATDAALFAAIASLWSTVAGCITN